MLCTPMTSPHPSHSCPLRSSRTLLHSGGTRKLQKTCTMKNKPCALMGKCSVSVNIWNLIWNRWTSWTILYSDSFIKRDEKNCTMEIRSKILPTFPPYALSDLFHHIFNKLFKNTCKIINIVFDMNTNYFCSIQDMQTFLCLSNFNFLQTKTVFYFWRNLVTGSEWHKHHHLT